MRIASTQYHATMNTALQNASVRLEDMMQKMSTGMRLLHPSDDPVTSVRVSRLTREEAALDQFLDNIGALRSRLQKNESVLGGMSQDLLNARDLLVWAADGGNTSEDLQAMSNSLSALRDSLFYSSNTRDQEGRYLFSGTATSTAALAYDATAAAGARYTYTGNTALQKVVVGNGVTEEANVTLQEMADLLNRMDRAAEVLGTPGVSINDPAVRADVIAGLYGIDLGIGALTSKMATLGGAQNMLDTLESNHRSVSLSNKQAMITLGQLDYAEAAVKLNGYTAAVQSTQKAYAKVSALSLFEAL
jgi:flagellar hook-associated protein 3 FlgL